MFFTATTHGTTASDPRQDGPPQLTRTHKKAMWLLQVDNLQFKEVPSHGPFPRYAILSHVWLKPNYEEITFQDVSGAARQKDSFRTKAGWKKVLRTVEQARRDGLEYCWIDTCCINKLNPTELTEAINCMYNWYANAEMCYTHLHDLAVSAPPTDFQDWNQPGVSWGHCEWFYRGWTLQELLAPPRLIFFDCEWVHSYPRGVVARHVAEITGIGDGLLCDRGAETEQRPPLISIHDFSVAQRFSWAAERQTTRPEDRAYSLVGLFGIVMQTHYGEGEMNAFRRLQEEIIKISTDQSILVWNAKTPSQELLAPSVDCFRDSWTIAERRGVQPTAYRLSNLGLHIRLPIFKLKDMTDNSYGAILNCRRLDDSSHLVILRLRKDYHIGQYIIDHENPNAPRYETRDFFSLSPKEFKAVPAKLVIARSSARSQAANTRSSLYQVLAAKLRIQAPGYKINVNSTFPVSDWSADGYSYQRTLFAMDRKDHRSAGVCLQVRNLETKKPSYIHLSLDVPSWHPYEEQLWPGLSIIASNTALDLQALCQKSLADREKRPVSLIQKFEDPKCRELWLDNSTVARIQLSFTDIPNDAGFSIMADRVWNILINVSKVSSPKQVVQHAMKYTIWPFIQKYRWRLRLSLLLTLIAWSYGSPAVYMIPLFFSLKHHWKTIKEIVSTIRAIKVDTLETIHRYANFFSMLAGIAICFIEWRYFATIPDGFFHMSTSLRWWSYVLAIVCIMALTDVFCNITRWMSSQFRGHNKKRDPLVEGYESRPVYRIREFVRWSVRQTSDEDMTQGVLQCEDHRGKSSKSNDTLKPSAWDLLDVLLPE